MTTFTNDVYKLTKDQENVYNTLKSGVNTFINGYAGTGKTFVLTKYIEEMRSLGKNVVVTAPSGIAAINIGGATIHRAFKVPVETAKIIKSEKEIKPNKVMKNADIIVIDEISMCSFEVFRYLSVEFFKCKNHKTKQMIVIGDFFQLPPVVPSDSLKLFQTRFNGYKEGFAFECPEWKKYNFCIVNLNEVVRQSDVEYISELNKARVGDKSCIPYFNRNIYGDHNEIPNTVLRVFPFNKNVEAYNNEQLSLIEEKSHFFDAYVIDPDNNLRTSDFVVPETLELKIGCRVMSVVNDVAMEYQNGSLGTVKSINPHNKTVGVLFDNGNYCEISSHDWIITRPKTVDIIDETGKLATKIVDERIGLISQFPLKLAYAVTVHKSQGQTFNSMVLDPYCFTHGQLYVALSRCVGIETLYLTRGIKDSYLLASESVKKFYQENNIVIDDAKDGNFQEDFVFVKIPAKYRKEVERFVEYLEKDGR